MYQIIVTGLSHKTAPLEIREGVARYRMKGTGKFYPTLNRGKAFMNASYLSTCNRTEFYLVTNDYENCIK